MGAGRGRRAHQKLSRANCKCYVREGERRNEGEEDRKRRKNRKLDVAAAKIDTDGGQGRDVDFWLPW